MEYKPTILHFSGHGEEGGAIVLEDNFGNPRPIPPEQLTELFDIFRGRMQGIVLNACWSEAQAEALVNEAGIPWVIGMEKPVGDTAAIDFAAGFYRGLGFGESVHTAFRLGRLELAGESPDERQTPKLLAGTGVDPATIKFS